MTDASDSDLPDLFFRTARRIRRTQQSGLAPLGLTPAQARALRILGHTPDPLRMSALADRLGIVPRSATTVVDALEAAGLATRTPDPANRRAVLVTLTEQGRTALNRMAEARRTAARDLFATLSPARRRTLYEILAELDASDQAGAEAHQSTS
ncbi:MarR family transcriptional regulator [Nocardia sp. 2]|uniref:MarR family transcriptional regulator n=1 Tax=Nocardia acididurans TaxID=2802282 RepID=A0ABS1LZP6_9NOCA|nr:MarR family transcriptional regulator [Nocardia acididurans]MBL1073888.1 MarR family transcriptional regulator [Nocardia acididurans]